MAERSLPSGLKTSLLAEDVHTYLHLVKFEKPRSAAESQFIAKKATDYAYISDAPYNVTFNDGSKDSKENANGDQVYVANKLLKVGTINETTEAKASNMNIELSGTALGTTLITNATFTSTTITTTSDLLYEGFQEGDVILLEGTGFANNGKYVRIDKFTNSNQTITVTGIDCVVTADSTAREYTLSFASDEIQALLTSKEATNYVNYINREVIIYKAHVNPETGAIIGEPFVIFRGIISKASVKDNVLQKSKVSWNLTSHWGDFIRVQGRVTSDYSHRALSVTGVSDKDALLRPEYEFDAGFAHAEKSINVLSTYQTMETRYKMKKRGGLAGLIGLKKVVEYQVEVDREVDLQFNLTARYLPVVYGVQRVDSIPIFADINKNYPNHVYVAHTICEGEIGGIYDVYIDENSSVCLDLNDSNARSSTSSNAAVLCNGRADKGDVLAGGSSRTTTVVNFLEDGEEIPFSTSPGGFNSVYRLPQSGTSFNSSGAQGIQHEDTFTFESPITTNLFIHTGKPHQDADDTLVNQAKLKNFKIQNELAVGDKNNYWSPNHKLLDTAYVVGKYIIKEGDTTIPKLEFVVRGKKIKSYNYDFSYDTDTTGSNAAHTNFTLGTSVTLHRTKAEGSNAADSQIGSDPVTIIDKWSFYRNTSTLHYRFRFSANPQDGVSTQFYMKDGSGNKWHMISHDHKDQTTLVNLGTPVTANVTAIGAYNSGAGTSGTRTITISANLPFHSQTSAGQFVCFNFSGVETTEAFRVVSTDTSNNTIVVNDNGRGFSLINQLLEAGNTCTLRNMNMIVLNASAAPSVNDAYNGRKIVITRFDTDDTILKEEERQIVTYRTAASPLPKIATLDVPMPFDFSPEATDFYVIHSGEDEEDIRVSINPAIQLLDYLKDKKHGKGLDDSDIDFSSFLQAARDCETRSDVTIQAVGDVTGSVAVGDVYEYAPSSVVKFRGTVKSRETKVVNVTATNGSVTATTFTQIIFNNVMGKLAYKWTNWRTFADNDYYWNKGLLYLKSGSGTVTTEPTSGHLTSNISLSKVTGSGGNTLTVSIQDTYSSSGNPVIKKFTNIVEGFNSPGYSLYDSDDVKYWIYLGWDEPEQRFVTRHQMNQIIDTSVPVFDNINSMLKQFNGILRYANGKYGLAIKQAAPASFETYQTITDDDIIGEINVQDKGQKQSFNSMAANVIDPQNKFNARSITYFNSDYLKQDKGIRRSGNFAMPGVSNYFNSRINIQQYLDESRYGLDISFKIDSKGLLLLTGEIIRVTNSRLGFNNKLFRISNLNFLSNCLVQVTAVEHNDSAYLVGNIKTAPAAKEIEDQGGTVNETVVATPDSPSGLTATTNAKGAIDLSWSNSSSFSTATHMTEVFASSTNDRTNATSIFNTQSTTMSHLITVQSLTTKYYWVRHTVVAQNGQIVNSEFHPTSSTGGVVGSATGAVDGAQGDRGAGRWHIQVSSLPTTSALANTRWGDGSGNQPTVAVVGDQAFFYTGTLSSPTAQKVWIYAGSNNWTEQTEVIDGDLLVQGTITADKMNVTTLSSITADIGSITAGAIKGGDVPDANAAPSGSETGAFMDLTNGKMVFGNASKHILFDGTNLQLSGVVIDSSSVVNSTAGVIVQEDTSQEASAATTLNFTTGLNVAVTGSAPSQTATVSLDSGFATLASPTFTGTPLAPTATAGTNTTQLATTAFVGTAVSDLVGAAPSDLDTLNELAAALADDASFSSTINTALGNRLRVDTNSQNLSSTQKTNALTNLGISSGSGVTSVSGTTPISVTSGATPTVSISAATTSAAGSLSASDKTQLDNLSTNLAAKANLASPTFTGTPIAPTATSGTNTTQIATTAFVQTAASSAASGAVNNGLLDINEGNLIDLTISGGDFTANKSSETDITINVDLSELSAETADIIGGSDHVVYLDGGTQKKKLFNQLKLSQFNNDSGFATTSGVSGSISSAVNDGTLTIFAGDGMGTNLASDDNVGSFTANQSSASNIIINHGNTSDQASSNNSGRTYIQDITLDTYGHVTGLATATETVTNTDQTITLSGDVSGSGTTSINVTVADDSHNHVISNVDGLQTALDGKQASGTYVTSVSGTAPVVSSGGTTPAISVTTAAVADGGASLATGDQIYDHVTSRISSFVTSSGVTSVATNNGITGGTITGTGTIGLVTNNVTNASVSGSTLTLTRQGASSVTFTDNNDNTTFAISVEQNTDNTNNNPRLRLTGSDTSTDNITIVGGGAITTTRDDSSQFTISHTDTNSTTSPAGFSNVDSLATSGKVKLLAGISHDTYGHITGSNGLQLDFTGPVVETTSGVVDIVASTITATNINSRFANFGFMAADVASITNLTTDFLDADQIISKDIRVGASAEVTVANFVVGRTYKVVNTGSLSQAQWNTIGGTTEKIYGPGKIFTAANVSFPTDANAKADDFNNIALINGSTLTGSGAHLNSDGDFFVGVHNGARIFFDQDQATLTVRGTLDADDLVSGSLTSTNHSGTGDGSGFSTAGTKINLSNGSISAKNFRIDSSGNAVFDGSIDASSATITNINASSINTGSLTSTNHSGTGDGSGFSTAGTKINLSNGSISAKNFRIDSSGNAVFDGSIDASSATITNISATSINTGVLNASNITVTNLDANSINDISLTATSTGSFVVGSSITPGTMSVLIGAAAGGEGSGSTATGWFALNHSTGVNNTGFGNRAGVSVSSGTYNTFVGSYSGYEGTSGAQRKTGDYNIGIGGNVHTNGVLRNLTSGSNNIAIGQGSGRDISTGSGNVIIGSFSGNASGYDIRTSSNNLVLSDGFGNIKLKFDTSANATFIGNVETTGSSSISTVLLNITGGSQIGQDYAYLKSNSTSTASLTLRKDSTGADSIDYLQLRSNSNGLLGKISGAGAVGAGDGTISLPSLSFVNDTNTGLYSLAADNLGFAIGGTARAYMSNTQFNVSAKIVATELDINGNADISGTVNSGAITSTGNITAFSDERLKSDIETLDGKKVLEMRGVEFIKDGVKGSGVVAQELEKIAPELVLDGDYKSVAYGNLTGYLIEAIKEQQSEINELKDLVKQLLEK